MPFPAALSSQGRPGTKPPLPTPQRKIRPFLIAPHDQICAWGLIPLCRRGSDDARSTPPEALSPLRQACTSAALPVLVAARRAQVPTFPLSTRVHARGRSVEDRLSRPSAQNRPAT